MKQTVSLPPSPGVFKPPIGGLLNGSVAGPFRRSDQVANLPLDSANVRNLRSLRTCRREAINGLELLIDG
jgi:hypothetical protein